MGERTEQRRTGRRTSRFLPRALETWQETVNPTDAIAGVISVTSAVLDLPRGVLEKFSAQDRAMVRALAASVPAIPVARSQNNTHADFLVTPAGLSGFLQSRAA